MMSTLSTMITEKERWKKTELEFQLMLISFTKMEGIGNDFVMLDAIQQPDLPLDMASLSKAMNDRHFGIGGDGLILLERGQQAPFKMRMFNPDGSESEMCGNGIRCFARLLKDHGHLLDSEVAVETGAGILGLRLSGEDLVTVDMGLAKFKRGEVGVTGDPESLFVEQPVQTRLGTAVSMGNPHLVVFVDNVSSVDLENEGPKLERDPKFPRKVNVHFAQVVSRTHLIQRTWERGAGITLACGTGACATGAAAFRTGRTDANIEIDLPGGRLQIDVAPDYRITMTGPARTRFTGSWPLSE